MYLQWECHVHHILQLYTVAKDGAVAVWNCSMNLEDMKSHIRECAKLRRRRWRRRKLELEGKMGEDDIVEQEEGEMVDESEEAEGEGVRVGEEGEAEEGEEEREEGEGEGEVDEYESSDVDKENAEEVTMETDKGLFQNNFTQYPNIPSLITRYM